MPPSAAILLHAWGRSRLDLLPRITPWHDLGTELLVPDRRGHGDSGGHAALGHEEDRDLRALLAELPDDQPIVIAAHADAVIPALRYAASAADPRLRGLVLVVPRIDPTSLIDDLLRRHGLPATILRPLVRLGLRLRGIKLHTPERPPADRVPCLRLDDADAGPEHWQPSVRAWLRGNPD